MSRPTKKRRPNEQPRVSFAAEVAPGAVFEHGMPQLSVETRSLDGKSNPIPNQMLAKRSEQNVFTLAPPQLRSMTDLVCDTHPWSNDAYEAMRLVYGPYIFAKTVNMRRNPELTADEQLACQVISSPDLATVTRVVTQQVPQYDPDTAHMLTAPTGIPSSKNKHQRPIRLADTTMAPIRDPKSSRSNESGQTTTTLVDGDRVTSKQRQKRIFQYDRTDAYLRYYPEDPEPDHDLMFGLDPSDYPSLREALYGAGNQHAMWSARYTALVEASENEGRASIPIVHREHLDKYRLPIVLFDPAERVFRRKCCNEAMCRGHALAIATGAPNRGYTLVEFLLPSEESRLLSAMYNNDREFLEAWNASPTRPCVECLLYRWTDEYQACLHVGVTPPHPINQFSVFVGPGEYSREVMLPIEIYSIPTGIEGHVPYYDLCHREFELLKPGNVHVIREVEVDFRSSLSQLNAWLGVAKTRPLAGAQGKRLFPLSSILDHSVSDPITANSTVGKILWSHYKKTLPVMLMADRALVQNIRDESETLQRSETRLPAIWLRQTILASSVFADYDMSLSSTMKHVAQLSIPKSIRRDLSHILQFGDNDVSSLDETLGIMAAVALCPFEITMDWLIQTQKDSTMSPMFLTGALRLLFDTSDQLPTGLRGILRHGDGLVRPPDNVNGWSMYNPLHCTNGSWVLYTAIVFRCATAFMFDTYIRPCHTHENTVDKDIGYSYKTMLFVDTHLDFLTRLSITSPMPDDRFFLQTRETLEPRLTRLYPQMTRVCCFEELPSLSPLLFSMNQWRDPQNKRSNTSEHDTFIHLIRKTLPSVCMMRSANNIFREALRQWPNIHKLVTQAMRCFWLGNYPLARNRPPLAVRLKINAMFAPLSALLDATPSLDMEQQRAKEIQDWIYTHPVLAITILREYSMSAIEATWSIDMARAQSIRWGNFKQVVRMAHGVLRAALIQLVKKNGTVDWSVLEKRTGGSSKGEVMKWHEKQKLHNTKLHKDTDYGIMLKKLQHVDSQLTIDASAMLTWLNHDNRLECIKVVAWTTAQMIQQPLASGKMRTGLLTGMLKCLGMTQRGYVRLRERLHGNVAYNISDNSFCDFMVTLHADAWQDYVLLKLYLLHVNHYASDGIRFTSIQHMRNQVNAIRHNLAIPGIKATPPGLGMANFCENCKKWAHPVVEPSDSYMGYPTRPMPKKRQSTRRKKKKASQVKTCPREPRPIVLADGQSAASLRVVYNPVDCKLYCKRGNVTETQREFREVGYILGIDDNETTSTNENDEEDGDEGDDTITLTNNPTTGTRDVVTQVFTEQFSCKNSLASVDLLGVYKHLGGIMYTRCVYCGIICDVISANMTNAGISCGEHALIDEYPEWHPIWKQIIRPSSTIRDVTHPDWIKTYPMSTYHRPCFKCKYIDPSGPVTHWVYDGLYRMAKLVLCKHDARVLKNLRHVPVSLEWLSEHVGL